MSKRPNFSKSEVVALSAIHEKETVRASYAIFDDDDGGDGDSDVVGVVEDNDDNVNKVDGDDDEDDGDDHNVDKDHSACVQQANGVKERMTRRKFRDFLHDQIGISSQVIADRIFVYFNKVFLNQIYFWESVVVKLCWHEFGCHLT